MAYTAKIPLFLDAFLCPLADTSFDVASSWTFDKALESFCGLKEVRNMHDHIQKFLGLDIGLRKTRLETMIKCVEGQSILVNRDLLDARYFHILAENFMSSTDQSANARRSRPICHYVAYVVTAIVESEKLVSFYRQSEWTQAIKLNKDNPSIQRFFVAKAVIGWLSDLKTFCDIFGMKSEKNEQIHFQTFDAIGCPPIDSTHQFSILTPAVYNYKAIDAVARIILPTNKLTTFFPSNVSSSKKQPRRSGRNHTSSNQSNQPTINQTNNQSHALTVMHIPIQITCTTIDKAKFDKSMEFRHARWCQDSRYGYAKQFMFISHHVSGEIKPPGDWSVQYVNFATVNEGIAEALVD